MSNFDGLGFLDHIDPVNLLTFGHHHVDHINDADQVDHVDLLTPQNTAATEGGGQEDLQTAVSNSYYFLAEVKNQR